MTRPSTPIESSGPEKIFKKMKGWFQFETKMCFLSVAILIVPGLFTPSLALVEWNIHKTLKLDTQPLDVAVSKNGNSIFVLTQTGKILIYSPGGKLKDKIEVGNHIDQIKTGPGEEWWYLSSRKNKTVEILHVDFIQHIDITGSPFKGVENAPVVIAVFSDFR